MKTTGSARTIRARMHADAGDRIGRLCQSSAEQTLAEVLDNARRAGAARLRITTGPSTLTIEDDGCGIARPEVLLSFGESGWKEPQGCDGIGIYALSGRDARIATRAANTPGWCVRLDKEHFNGDAAAAVEPLDDDALRPHGTRVTFHYPRTAIRDRVVDDAVRHLRMAVTIDGRPVEWSDPLGHCCYVHRHEDVRIGVERRPREWRKFGEFHFHGRSISDRRLPRAGCGSFAWVTKIEVGDTSGLRRALPHRTRVEENQAYHDLLHQAEKVLYTAMARDDEAEPDHANWRRALQCGIDLPAPTARLETWRPEVADASGLYETREAGALIDLDGSEVLVFGAFEPGDEQVIARAVTRSPGVELKLVRENPERAGFEWYDNLKRLTGYGFEIVSEGGKRRRSFTRPGAPADDWVNEHVDEISMYLEITDPKARHTDGEKTYVPVDADLVMTNPEVRTTPDMLGIKLLGTSRAGAAQLRELMAKTCFRLPTDCEEEERRERLEAEAEEIADVLVKGPNEALSRALAKIAEREIGPLVGPNASVTIRFADDGASVRVDERYAENGESGAAR